jgi:putative nucleotidyltransferase with HDIG domain
MNDVKILIVEDEMIVAEDVKKILRRLGYVVCAVVSSGKEAVIKAEQNNPDLVLMDIVLKGSMTGVEAADQIRTRFEIPIVYLTAYADKETLERAKITVPYGYILKPFGERELHSTIEIALHKKQMEMHIKHLNTVLRAIRNVNLLITKEKNRNKLLKGICNNLIETRGYDTAWIAIIDESGSLVTTAHAGLGKGFLPMLKLMKRGKFPECGRKAIKQHEVLVIEDVSSACANCPLFDKHKGRGALVVRLESDGKIYGLLAVSIAPDFITDEDELSLFSEVAADVALALHTIKIEEERERVMKELEESETRLKNIINTNADGIIIVDKKGLVRFVNPAAEKLFSIGHKEILGELFGFPVVTGETAEIDITRKNKEKIVAEMHIVDIDWQGKTAYLASLRDITSHKQTAKALQQSLEKSQRILQETVKALASALEKRDPYTAGHSLRVAQLAFALAKELDMPQDEITGIHMAAAIHDIGKIYVPAEILSKPNKLTEGEFMIIKSHSQVGYDILKNIEFPWPIAEIVLQHHERLNGSGYPQGLKDRDILHEAKILGVADVVEAMCSHRPYRPAPGLDKALEEIKKNRGKLYEPAVVDVCLRLFKEKGFNFE